MTWYTFIPAFFYGCVLLRNKTHLTKKKTSRRISWPIDIYLFKVNNRNSTTICEICSKFAIKTQEKSQWRRSCVFTVNSEQIPNIVLVFPFLDFEPKIIALHNLLNTHQVNTCSKLVIKILVWCLNMHSKWIKRASNQLKLHFR